MKFQIIFLKHLENINNFINFKTNEGLVFSGIVNSISSLILDANISHGEESIKKYNIVIDIIDELKE